MNTTNYLEWFFRGEWQRIGWQASTEQSKQDLFEHGRLLAAARGDRYRIVTPSHLADEPPTVLFTFNPGVVMTS